MLGSYSRRLSYNKSKFQKIELREEAYSARTLQSWTSRESINNSHGAWSRGYSYLLLQGVKTVARKGIRGMNIVAAQILDDKQKKRLEHVKLVRGVLT